MTEPKSGGEINVIKRELLSKWSFCTTKLRVQSSSENISEEIVKYSIQIELRRSDFLFPNDLFYLLKVILSFIYESIDVELN